MALNLVKLYKSKIARIQHSSLAAALILMVNVELYKMLKSGVY